MPHRIAHPVGQRAEGPRRILRHVAALVDPRDVVARSMDRAGRGAEQQKGKKEGEAPGGAGRRSHGAKLNGGKGEGLVNRGGTGAGVTDDWERFSLASAALHRQRRGNTNDQKLIVVNSIENAVLAIAPASQSQAAFLIDLTGLGIRA